jgi:hypothetical protein
LLQGKTPSDWRQVMYHRYWMHLALGSKGAIDQPTAPEWEMFDLVTDPHEMYDVHDEPAYSSVREELEKEMFRLQAEVKDSRVG